MGTITSLAEYKESADRAALRRRMQLCTERMKVYEAKGDRKGMERTTKRFMGYLQQRRELDYRDGFMKQPGDAPHAG